MMNNRASAIRKLVQHTVCVVLLGGMSAAAFAQSTVQEAAETSAAESPNSPAAAEAQAEQRWAMLDEYCLGCHNLNDWAGELALDLLDHEALAADAETWEKVVRKLRGRMMPPPGESRPGNPELDSFIAWLETELDQAAADSVLTAKPLHRLNRTEYARAVHDLLQLKIDPESLLPVDGAEDGFDNIAAALQVTPTFIDQYINAARVVSEQAVGSAAARSAGTVYNFSTSGQAFHIDGLPLGSRGGAVVEHYFPSDGEYRLNIGTLASGLAFVNLDHASTLIASIDGRIFFRTEIAGREQREQLDKLRSQAVDEMDRRLKNIPFTTTAGPHRLAVTFLHRSFAEADSPLQQISPRKGQDAVAVLRQFEIVGPVATSGLSMTPSRDKVFSCHPARGDEADSCAYEIVSRLANEAFRGSLAAEDSLQLMQLYERGAADGGFEQGISFALSGILAHPKFLYRFELQSDSGTGDTLQELSSLELASRLSFFLWGSIPDDELLQLAQEDALKRPAVLEAQVRRMLRDTKSDNLANNFAYQWLGLGGLSDVTPDSRLFADVDTTIRADLTKELLLFVDSIFREDRSVLDLLAADHSYLNENLALHYGLNSVRGSQFRRVELADERRWGILGKGAVLMTSSYPNRTSPVLRGAWLLEKILGTPPAAPPPDVEGFVEIEAGEEFTTVRERLESHRSNPSCNGCHGVIDPLGFALENFDATGRWREIDRHARVPIDASGVLADGTPIEGPVALRAALLSRPEQFVQTFTEKLMTFGLGRSMEYSDMPAIRRIVRESAAENYRFSAIVLGIINSEQFRMRASAAARGAEVIAGTAQTD